MSVREGRLAKGSPLIQLVVPKLAAGLDNEWID